MSREMLNSQLIECIAEREKVVAVFIAELTFYEQEQRKKFHSRSDRLFSQEQHQKSSFIWKLKNALENYKKSGNADELLTFVLHKKESLQGFNLRSILNRLIVCVNELHQPTPDHYDFHSGVHERATAILQNLHPMDPDFVTQVENLYAEVERLRKLSALIQAEGYEENGKVAQKLAETLQKKIDQFIIDNQKKFADKMASLSEKKFFKAFHTDFICHIHSRDDVMHQHKAWLPLLADVALASLNILTSALAAPAQQYLAEVMKGNQFPAAEQRT